MPGLEDLYREIILDHYRTPRNRGELPPPAAHAVGHNPLCGDRLTLSLKLDGDRVEDVRFEGKGCAISTASASMMTEAIKGKDRATIDALFTKVHTLLTEQNAVPSPDLGKLAALSGVREFPVRVKCALLPWTALLEIIQTWESAPGHATRT